MRHYRTLVCLFIVLLILMASGAYIGAQDAAPESTAEVSMTVAPTDTPTSTPTETPTATLTPTATASPEITAEATILPTATDTPSPEFTAELTEPPVATTETASPEATEASTLPSASPTDTPSSESTEESTPELTETAAPPTAETDTPTVIPMALFQGAARYQNRLPDNSGILVVIRSGNGVTLSTAATTPEGAYSVLAPSEEFFWLTISAPLHRRFELGIWPGETLPDVTLAGGDLDGDGCIGPLDIALLTAQFGVLGSTRSDITNDGVTDAPDLAILAGNYEPALCPAIPTPEATEMAVPSESPTAEVTEAATLMPESTPETGGG